MSLYPLPYDLTSTRPREDEGLLVDITAAGSARARRRHARYRFLLEHAWLDGTERQTLQTWCEQHEGEVVTLVWSDGRTYEGLLGAWNIDERAGPLGQATVEIRGARVLP